MSHQKSEFIFLVEKHLFLDSSHKNPISNVRSFKTYPGTKVNIPTQHTRDKCNHKPKFAQTFSK